MMARAVLLIVFATVLTGLAAAPTAAAGPTCVVGSSEPECAVSIQSRVCVTEPCDELDVCVAYGRFCPV